MLGGRWVGDDILLCHCKHTLLLSILAVINVIGNCLGCLNAMIGALDRSYETMAPPGSSLQQTTDLASYLAQWSLAMPASMYDVEVSTKAEMLA